MEKNNEIENCTNGDAVIQEHVTVTEKNTPSDTSSETSSVITVIENEHIETTRKFLLQFSKSCRPFKLPLYPEIAFNVSNHFDDPFCNVTPKRMGSEEAYIIELTKPVPKYGNSLKFFVEGKNYNVDIEPYEYDTRFNRRNNNGGRNDRENNLLLTFHGAGRIDYDHIPMMFFDDIITKDLNLELERHTEKQKIYGTQLFNGNRFCVIKKPDNLARIPEFIPIEHPTEGSQKIYIKYNGRLYNCGRCNSQHTGRCPQLVEFYAAKDERNRMEKDKEIVTKIISDSTLRNADQLGLRADIMTMSGGGLGQVLQAARDDPDCRDKENIVIIGGTNDIKNRSYEKDAEYTENMKATIAKLKEIAAEEPKKKLTIVNSHPRKAKIDVNTPDFIITEKARETYLHNTLEENIRNFKDLDIPIKNVAIMDVQYDIDDTGHPTVDGTKEILEKINDFLDYEKKLIWNSKFITTENMYRGVQSIYRYGCNHCDGFGQSIQHTRSKNGNVCDDCMDLVKHSTRAEENEEMLDIRKQLRQYVKDSQQRSLSSDDEDIPPKSKKQCLIIPSNHDDGKQDENMATDD